MIDVILFVTASTLSGSLLLLLSCPFSCRNVHL